MTNSETVKYVYDKFAKGDVPALLATFDSNIEFRLAEGHPYSPEGRPWIGGEAITRNFFAKGSEWDGWSIGIHSLEDFGDTVVVQGRYGGVYANLSEISSTGTVYAGDLLALGKKQLARVVTGLR